MKVNGIEFDELEQEYLTNGEMFTNSDMIDFLCSLPLKDRRLLILYAEIGSLREIARIYNCSHQLIHKRIEKIRTKYKNVKQ